MLLLLCYYINNNFWTCWTALFVRDFSETLIELKNGSKLQIFSTSSHNKRKMKTSSACHKSFPFATFFFLWIPSLTRRAFPCFHSGLMCPTLVDLHCLMSSGTALESGRLLLPRGRVTGSQLCFPSLSFSLEPWPHPHPPHPCQGSLPSQRQGFPPSSSGSRAGRSGDLMWDGSGASISWVDDAGVGLVSVCVGDGSSPRLCIRTSLRLCFRLGGNTRRLLADGHGWKCNGVQTETLSVEELVLPSISTAFLIICCSAQNELQRHQPDCRFIYSLGQHLSHCWNCWNHKSDKWSSYVHRDFLLCWFHALELEQYKPTCCCEVILPSSETCCIHKGATICPALDWWRMFFMAYICF